MLKFERNSKHSNQVGCKNKVSRSASIAAINQGAFYALQYTVICGLQAVRSMYDYKITELSSWFTVFARHLVYSSFSELRRSASQFVHDAFCIDSLLPWHDFRQVYSRIFPSQRSLSLCVKGPQLFQLIHFHLKTLRRNSSWSIYSHWRYSISW